MNIHTNFCVFTSFHVELEGRVDEWTDGQERHVIGPIRTAT